jgi:multiple sugar transport system substrate-binding protein
VRDQSKKVRDKYKREEKAMRANSGLSRRDFLKLASTAVVGGLLASCAPAAQPEKEEEAAPAEGPVTLEYWFCWSGIYQEIQREHVLNAFDEEFEGKIQVHDLPVPSNIRQKLLTAVAAGQSPDAAACFGDLISLAAQGAFMVIDDYVEASEVVELDEIYDARLAACRWMGKQYGFPYNCSAELLLFNVDLFEEAGIDWEEPFETWDEFTEVSKKLVKFDEQGDLTQAAYTNWFPRHSALWFWCNGGKAYDADTNTLSIDDPKNIEGLQTVIDYAWDVYGDVAKADEFVAGAGSATESPFCVGMQAVDYVGDWMPSVYYEWCPDVRIWPYLFPKGPQGTEMVASNAGDFVGVLRGAPHPDEAYKFVEWMVMKGNLKWTEAGIDTNCLAKDAGVVREDWPDIFGSYDEAAEVSKWWAEQMIKSRPVENTPVYGFMNDEVRRVFDLAFHKEMTAAEALQEAQQNVLEEMDKYTIPT